MDGSVPLLSLSSEMPIPAIYPQPVDRSMVELLVQKLKDRAAERIPTRTLALYLAFFVVSLIIVVSDFIADRIDQLVISIPIMVMLGISIVTDRKVAHVPPMLIFMMMIALIMVLIASELREEHGLFNALASLLTGVCLMLMGQVVVYTMIRASPQRPSNYKLFVYSAAFAFAMTVLLLMFMVEIGYFHHNDRFFDIWDMTEYVFGAMVGALITALLCELGLDRVIIDSSINRSLEVYSDSTYSNEMARDDALNIIKSGESDKLEFKSTIVTNIRTGENDKRMEKAVLKSIVAFMNTSGGILMVGVADDGSIYGVDENAFDSRDKMNLHLTHMISSRIGDEFLPYISFRVIDMEDGKAIIRVDCERCKKPVFLKDGKEEEFYVRSGPSSVALTGSNLVNYITNKSAKDRQNILSGLMVPLQNDD